MSYDGEREYDMPADERAKRDEAMKRVEKHAAEEWKREATRCVSLCASFYREQGFTAADVKALMTTTTHEGRAMGPVLASAKRRGIIVDTGDYRKTGSHLRPQAVWRAA